MIETRVSAASPAVALQALLAVVAASAGLAGIGAMLPPMPEAGPPHGDLDTYAEVIAALRGGTPYYHALHEALLAHGYGTLSVFNWRPPAFMTGLAAVPPWMAQAVLCGLVGTAMLATARLVVGLAGRMAALSVLGLLAASLAACLVPDAALMCELYAGALILLSASGYGLGRHRLGFAAGLLALLFREIAAPYTLICAVLAWRQGRRAEAGAWLLAILLYALYFGWHAVNVMTQLGPQDHAGPGWLALGGATFVLLAAAFNGIFLVLPFWLTGLVLPLAVLGLVAMPDQARDRFLVPVLCYLALFAFVGRPVNSYWGALITPLLMPGLVFAPAAVRDLLTTASRGGTAVVR